MFKSIVYIVKQVVEKLGVKPVVELDIMTGRQIIDSYVSRVAKDTARATAIQNKISVTRASVMRQDPVCRHDSMHSGCLSSLRRGVSTLQSDLLVANESAQIGQRQLHHVSEIVAGCYDVLFVLYDGNYTPAMLVPSYKLTREQRKAVRASL